MALTAVWEMWEGWRLDGNLCSGACYLPKCLCSVIHLSTLWKTNEWVSGIVILGLMHWRRRSKA